MSKMSRAISIRLMLGCASLLTLGTETSKTPHCPELTDAHERAAEEVVVQLAEGRISEEEALARMREIIPVECHAVIIDEQRVGTEPDAP
jgi:hypothetical protein